MIKRSIQCLLSLPMWVLLFGTALASGQGSKKPKLVVVLVIDQWRADQVAKFETRYLPARGAGGKLGGFRYLLDQGAYYPFAEHGNFQNMTGPGHATILSGAFPYQHGISTNDWVNGDTGELEYCVLDPESPLIGAAGGEKRGGISPKNLRASTLGDELKNSGYPSRVVTLALKDRSAVLLGGHRADLALWYEPGARRWVSSRYYLADNRLPAWVEAFNSKLEKESNKELIWTAEGPGSGTSLATNDFIMMKRGPEVLQKTFPHKISAQSSTASLLPYGTDMTVELALEAVDAFKLGTGPAPDVLGVSLSNHDFVSHAFGPNSREVEEITVAEDRAIARLFQALDKRLGLENVLIAMTADHGAPPIPEWLKSQKVPAGRLDEKNLKDEAEKFLRNKYGAPTGTSNWVLDVSELNFYLNRKAIAAGKLNRVEVEEGLAEYFRNRGDLREAVAYVFTSNDVKRRTLPPGIFEKSILRTYTEGRSGDVTLIPRPFFIINTASTTHISNYAYDRIVPLFLMGPGIKAGRYGQKAEVIDIAPTLAYLLGTTPPSGSEGRVLHEALR